MTSETQQWKRSRRIFKPREEQIQGMELIMGGRGTRLFLHPGRGKTATVLKAFCLLKEAGLVDKLVVLAPLRVITTSWPFQLEHWKDFEHLTYTIVHGNRSKAMLEDTDVYLMNVEGLLTPEWRLGKGNALNPTAVKFLQRGRTMLAIDESTKFKNSQSSRFKTIKRYLPLLSYHTIMTGTPKPNKVEDLFAQCYLTDAGKDLGQYITHFRREYMRPAESGFGYEALPGAMEKIAAKIASTTLQIDDVDAIPTQIVPVWVQMPESAKAIYKELQDELIAMIEGKVVLAPNAGVLYGKLRQVAQGAIYDAEKNVMEVHAAKLDALENLLEELGGEPAFCLIQYKHDTARIRARLGYPVPCIASGTSVAQGVLHAAQFSSGNMPLLLGHPQSVAHGIDGLQNSCRNVIWFGLDSSWENTYQANKRIARSGTTAETVYIYQILVDCPVEHAVLESISDKQMSEAEFLTCLRKHIC